MAHVWMVRAGQGGYVAEDFAQGNIAIGWNKIGDLSRATTSEDIRSEYLRAYPEAKQGEIANVVAMIHKFRSIIRPGDPVITFDKARREYLVGRVVSDYMFKPGDVKDHPHIRKVEWQGRVSRDHLRVASRNTLGSTLTLFSVPEDVWSDVSAALKGLPPDVGALPETAEQEREELEETRQDTQARALELIKDRILRLDDHQLEHLVAALLRGMGYRTRVTPRGRIGESTSLRLRTGLGFKSRALRWRLSIVGTPASARRIFGAFLAAYGPVTAACM